MITQGRFTYGEIVQRGSGNNITIGSFCSIAIGVIFDGGFNHRTDFVSTYPLNRLGIGNKIENKPLESNINIKGNIIVGNDVWIGENATIMSGVTIGDGAIIGMNAIVSKNVMPYEIIVGAPQKVLRKRFSEEQIEKLLALKWWNWDIEKIEENAHLIQSSNIDEFLNKHNGVEK